MLRDDEESFCPNKLWVIQGRLAKAGIAPLHPAIIEGSFPGYVCTFKFGPLFPKLIPGKFGKRGGNGTKVVGRWVRSFDLKDKLSTMCLAR